MEKDVEGVENLEGECLRIFYNENVDLYVIYER